jgi:hypothetical protein
VAWGVGRRRIDSILGAARPCVWNGRFSVLIERNPTTIKGETPALGYVCLSISSIRKAGRLENAGQGARSLDVSLSHASSQYSVWILGISLVSWNPSQPEIENTQLLPRVRGTNSWASRSLYQSCTLRHIVCSSQSQIPPQHCHLHQIH